MQNTPKLGKIVVTGGLGFIGSEIVKQLAHKYEVIVIDDFSTGKEDRLKGYPYILIQKDICQITKKDLENVEAIIHTAAKTSVPHSFEDEAEFYRVNVLGTANILLAAREAQVKKIIYSSSSSVYGETQGQVAEQADISCLSPYAMHKYQGELLCEIFAKQFDMTCIALRYFNAYGENQDPHNPYSGAITKFKDQIAKGEPLIIHGDGTQYRDFIHTKDIARANILALSYWPTEKFDVFNIASGIATSIIDIANMLGGKNYSKEFQEKRQGDFHGNAADVTKAQQKLGFKAQYMIEKELSTFNTSPLSMNSYAYAKLSL